jgi:serine/threonine-protein kinase
MTERTASFLAELRRRNVIRVAGLYVVGAWLIVQVADTVLPIFHTPDWVLQAMVVLLALGLIPALVFSWVFELTPEGLKRERDIDRSQSVVDQTARKLDLAVIVMLAVVAGLVLWRPTAQMGSASVDAGSAATPGADAARPDSTTTVDAEPVYGAEKAVDPASDASIAVLPFVDMSQARDQEYFSDGLSEELLNLLAQIPQLRVIARTSSFSFKGKDVDVATIAEALGVSTILEGSVRSSGKRLRITAQLIRASDASHLWSQTYDRELTDVFEVQDEIATAVVEALKVQLLPNQQVTNPYRSSNALAHDRYLLGRQLLRRPMQGGLVTAIEYFQRAIELDPGYAAAYAALSNAELYIADSAGDPAGKQRALAYANKAIELAPGLIDGYLARAQYTVFVTQGRGGALQDLQQALAINAGSAEVQEGHGRVLVALGRVDEAIAALRKATELDPLSVASWSMLGRVLNAAGRYDEAESALERAVTLSSSDYTHFHLGITYLLQGRAEEALAEFEKRGRTDPPGRSTAGIALAAYSLGRMEQSEQTLQSIIARQAAGMAYQIAEVYAWRGESDRALEWLERARVQNDGGLGFVRADPLLAKLADDPRFVEFLRRLDHAEQAE